MRVNWKCSHKRLWSLAFRFQVFFSLGFDRVYSALSVDENQISHRGRALQKLLKHLLNGR